MCCAKFSFFVAQGSLFGEFLPLCPCPSISPSQMLSSLVPSWPTLAASTGTSDTTSCYRSVCFLALSTLLCVGDRHQHLEYPVFKTCLAQQWQMYLDNASIPYTADFKLVETLASPGQRLTWQSNSLPSDDLCEENAVILDRFVRDRGLFWSLSKLILCRLLGPCMLFCCCHYGSPFGDRKSGWAPIGAVCLLSLSSCKTFLHTVYQSLFASSRSSGFGGMWLNGVVDSMGHFFSGYSLTRDLNSCPQYPVPHIPDH